MSYHDELLLRGLKKLGLMQTTIAEILEVKKGAISNAIHQRDLKYLTPNRLLKLLIYFVISGKNTAKASSASVIEHLILALTRYLKQEYQLKQEQQNYLLFLAILRTPDLVNLLTVNTNEVRSTNDLFVDDPEDKNQSKGKDKPKDKDESKGKNHSAFFVNPDSVTDIVDCIKPPLLNKAIESRHDIHINDIYYCNALPTNLLIATPDGVTLGDVYVKHDNGYRLLNTDAGIFMKKMLNTDEEPKQFDWGNLIYAEMRIIEILIRDLKLSVNKISILREIQANFCANPKPSAEPFENIYAIIEKIPNSKTARSLLNEVKLYDL